MATPALGRIRGMESTLPVVLDLTVTSDPRLFAASMFACISGGRPVVCPREDLYTLAGLASGYLPDYRIDESHVAALEFYKTYWSRFEEYIRQDVRLDDPGAPLVLALYCLKLGWLKPVDGAMDDNMHISCFLALPKKMRRSYRDWDGSLSSFIDEHLSDERMQERMDADEGRFLQAWINRIDLWDNLVGRQPAKSVRVPTSYDQVLRHETAQLIDQFDKQGNHHIRPVGNFEILLSECLTVSLSRGSG
jgi:hypothetical protein